jgi:hypothetical protein
MSPQGDAGADPSALLMEASLRTFRPEQTSSILPVKGATKRHAAAAGWRLAAIFTNTQPYAA